MVDLVELVRETVEDIRPFFVQRSLNLTFDAPPARIWVNGDRTRLEQVASNLLHNASKFTDRGGNVVVTVEAHGGEAQLRVRDDGVGIAPALMSMLFGAFVQGEKTLDRSRGGLGLGLSLVRGIAELHGGSVAARSEGVGKGSEFIVTLPTTEAPAPITAEPKPARAPLTSKRRVVIVEDNLDAAEALRDLLEVLGGHEVNVAYDGESGVNAIRRYTPDIVLCDLGLPGIDGYEVARRVRADGVSARTRLVALSGYASTDDIERALRAGFDYHLAKPPDAHRILDLVADAGAATAATLPAALVTGHGELDFRHGSILADAALLRSASADTLWESLRSLERHAVADFDYEEEVMENVKYPQLDAHRQEHRDFLTTFGQLQEKLRREGATPENVRALAHAVETWLPAHVEDEDRRFAEFVRGQITRAA
jgi:hemerythrin-like metal-binding protein